MRACAKVDKQHECCNRVKPLELGVGSAKQKSCVSLKCCVMQVFCGMLARIEQFADILQDSKIQMKKVSAACG